MEEAIRRLEAYCRSREWSGHDPYDALNSEFFARTPLAKSYVARLAFTQLLKRSPVNLRQLLSIKPQQNPKAIALFLTYYARRVRFGDAAARATARQLATRLLELRSPGLSYWCWGYSFPWQMRQRLVPRFAPNIVCTTFAANALVDAHEIGLGAEFFNAAVSAGEYIAGELYWSQGEHAGFAYPLPDIRVPIHNANFLGAALLCRLARLTGETASLKRALVVARYSAKSQRHDGSWPYGLASTQQWVDNFHTGYNLCALRDLGRRLETDEFSEHIARGFAFYRAHFVRSGGIAPYFHDRIYPIDIHCVAQTIITLATFRDLDPVNLQQAHGVLQWALGHMWDDRGFFYYRALRCCTIRTSYMRWSQAWMLLAMSMLLSGTEDVPRSGESCFGGRCSES